MLDGQKRGEKLVALIYAEREAQDEPRRPNSLRPSELGHECMRALWFRFRWSDRMETFPGRMLRLFNRGQREEQVFVDELKSVGAEVIDRDPNNRAKQIKVTTVEGNSTGYIDAIAHDVPFAVDGSVVCEFKTSSTKNFTPLKKKGVKKAMPKHYSQMLLYMLELGVTEALYLSVNKDTDEIYAEFVPFDAFEATQLMEKAERVVFADIVPPKLSNDASFYVCKMCAARSVCHQGHKPDRNCRNCMESRPSRESDKPPIPGQWICQLHGRWLDLDQQRRGCDDHRFHPDIVSGGNQTPEEIVVSGHYQYRYMLDVGEYIDMGPSGDR